MQAPAHSFPLAIGLSGHTQAAIEKRSAWTGGGQQESDCSSGERFAGGIYHPHHWLMGTPQANAVDGAVAFHCHDIDIGDPGLRKPFLRLLR